MFTPQSATVLVIRCIRDAENSIPTQFLNKVFSLHCCQKFPRMHSNPSKFDMGAGRVYPEIFYSNDSICKFKKALKKLGPKTLRL